MTVVDLNHVAKSLIGFSIFVVLWLRQQASVGNLGWEGPLEKERATHSNILASGIPMAGAPGRL